MKIPETKMNMELLKKANRPPLYVSRMKTIGAEMYKCRHQLNPTFVSNMFSVPVQFKER